MPVITLNGLMGSGGTEVGAEVARELHIDFVDRLVWRRPRGSWARPPQPSPI